MTLSHADLESLHQCSTGHRDLLVGAPRAGCFHCGAIFAPSDIVEWIDGDLTALCPRCGIDAVLPETTPIALDAAVLEAMRLCWFKREA